MRLKIGGKTGFLKTCSKWYLFPLKTLAYASESSQSILNNDMANENTIFRGETLRSTVAPGLTHFEVHHVPQATGEESWSYDATWQW